MVALFLTVQKSIKSAKTYRSNPFSQRVLKGCRSPSAPDFRSEGKALPLQIVADLELDKSILKEAAGGKILTPTQRRPAVATGAGEVERVAASGVPGDGSAAVDAEVHPATAQRPSRAEQADAGAGVCATHAMVTLDHSLARNVPRLARDAKRSACPRNRRMTSAANSVINGVARCQFNAHRRKRRGSKTCGNLKNLSRPKGRSKIGFQSVQRDR